MCGINGVVGLNNISEFLFQGIRNLEYRGYDSCGVALMNKTDLIVRKNTGGVEEFFRTIRSVLFINATPQES
jgi:glucosamine--fructose-6-phosphate aminotransferase (isomerizing)